jgi:hypothetical protein
MKSRVDAQYSFEEQREFRKKVVSKERENSNWGTCRAPSYSVTCRDIPNKFACWHSRPTSIAGTVGSTLMQQLGKQPVTSHGVFYWNSSENPRNPASFP